MASDLNVLLQNVIDNAYQTGFLTDSEADALESGFLGEWAED